MLFLTYVKGDLVRTWVLAASHWLGQEVTLYHVDQLTPTSGQALKEPSAGNSPTRSKWNERKTNYDRGSV
jgi:hypothetical protein